MKSTTPRARTPGVVFTEKSDVAVDVAAFLAADTTDATVEDVIAWLRLNPMVICSKLPNEVTGRFGPSAVVPKSLKGFLQVQRNRGRVPESW